LATLLLALLGLVAQQRVLTPAVRSSAPLVRLVAERLQSIETHAVRAQPALRVVAAPVFVRIPSFGDGMLARASVRVPERAEPPPSQPGRPSIAHFHGQRRIPRMNSEEPPRA